MERVLDAFGNARRAQKIRDSSARISCGRCSTRSPAAERRKTAAKPTEGQPQAGLTPWREVITASRGRRVRRVRPGRVRRRPLRGVQRATRTRSTRTRRRSSLARTSPKACATCLSVPTGDLSGDGGDPVIELQTNFGGGKTHSMIALYHLASGASAQRSWPGVGEALAEAEPDAARQADQSRRAGRPDDLAVGALSRLRRASSCTPSGATSRISSAARPATSSSAPTTSTAQTRAPRSRRCSSSSARPSC